MLTHQYPASLLSRRFKLMSQNEEDGVTLALLKLAGTPNRTFVEIGSGAIQVAIRVCWRKNSAGGD